MLSDVIEYLVCPVCEDSLSLAGRALRCPAGHSFDVARQGYVNLVTGAGASGRPGDTAVMVAARDAFLSAGHFDPLAVRLREHAEGHDLVVDAGAGTGHYLAAVLSGERPGLALDGSKYALRRAARVRGRVGAVACDLWGRLPVRTACAELIVNVFAPRNGAEFHRLLRPDGRLLVVTPTRRHLRELVTELGLLEVDEEKEARLARALGDLFRREHAEELDLSLRLASDAVAAVVGMGPSARHIDLRPIAGARTVTASFRIAVYRPVHAGGPTGRLAQRPAPSPAPESDRTAEPSAWRRPGRSGG